jgi:hypothetical protein
VSARHPIEIRRWDAIDARWLTQALQASGVDAEVEAFTAKPVGTGQIGDSIRFSLVYARAADDAPASLVGKFPSLDPTSFNAGVSGGNYVREVMFYRHLAPTALVSTPRCYAAEVDETTGEFVLLMEDLAPAEQGDQLKGVTLDQARLVIDEAAKLHASHWGDEALGDYPWIVGGRRAVQPIPALTAQDMWRSFKERYEGQLDPVILENGARLAERIEQFRAARAGPRCLTHYDFRPDNMMFATAAGGRPVTVLDWQSVALDAGPTDLGYFLGGALPAEVRREHEPEFLARYFEGLTSRGVSDYDEAMLKRDYALGGLRLLMIAFMSSIRVKRTPRGDEMFLQMARSGTRLAVDHDALRWLD